MRKEFILSIFSVFLVACASNDKVAVATKEPIQYLNLTSDDEKELVEKYWIVEERQAPKYPIDAARKGLSGCVDLIIGINSDGRLGSYRVKSSYPEGLFDENAIAALTQWKWVATETNSDKTPVLTSIQLDFILYGSTNEKELESQCGNSNNLHV